MTANAWVKLKVWSKYIVLQIVIKWTMESIQISINRWLKDKKGTIILTKLKQQFGYNKSIEVEWIRFSFTV